MLTHLDFLTFEADMLSRKGMNLSTRIEDDDDAPNKVERFIDRVLMIVEAEISRYNMYFDYAKLTEKQQDLFYEACLEQALYLYILGDMSLISGYDPINNTVVSIEEIRKRAMSPNAKQLLMSAGLLFRGVR